MSRRRSPSISKRGSIFSSTSAPDGILPRQQPNCGSLSVDDLRKIPAWATLQDYATTSWGGDWTSISTDDARVCVPAGPVKINTGDQSCTQVRKDERGAVIVPGKNASSIRAPTEITLNSTVTVTRPAAFPEGAVSSIIGIPSLRKADKTLSSTLNIDNSASAKGTANAYYGDYTMQMLTAQPGQTCFMPTFTASCDGTGRGTVQFVAQGNVVFNYATPRNGQTQWTVTLETTLPDAKNRTSGMDFAISIQSTYVTSHDPYCVFPDGTGANTVLSSDGAGGEASSKSGSVYLALIPAILLGVVALGVLAFGGHYFYKKRRQARGISIESPPPSMSSIRGTGTSSPTPLLHSTPSSRPASSGSASLATPIPSPLPSPPVYRT